MTSTQKASKTVLSTRTCQDSLVTYRAYGKGVSKMGNDFENVREIERYLNMAPDLFSAIFDQEDVSGLVVILPGKRKENGRKTQEKTELEKEIRK